MNYMTQPIDINKIFDLTGKVAIVTGGGDGIGRGACEILAAAGASVVVSNLTMEKADNVANVITANGGNAVAMQCDVSSDSDLVRLVEQTRQKFGTINILVNNVGLGGGGKENPFKIDRAYIERIYNINLFAPWRLCQLTAPIMAESGYGSIINITSTSSINNDPDMSIYGSSKAALNHLSSNLAYDFGPMGIRINCVGPGATRTHALASVLTPDIERRMLSRTPIKRLGEVSDIARAILFFASPASAWITGQTLFVNGGGVQSLD